ncbi:hypothetical protein KALB_4161 [Kutzneria albida DSM 43870]|uniref:Uncharacterized protein n=2 Tax=Kutzneria TaxID=43356 RepID=W5W9T6_9PSEU|nr:hypothetical protein KALB_4161 [Kutzneria albida DSM 43870]
MVRAGDRGPRPHRCAAPAGDRYRPSVSNRSALVARKRSSYSNSPGLSKYPAPFKVARGTMVDDKGTSRSALRPIQLIAGALAAVTAALLGSLFGVAGTVIGAGLASLVSAVGATVYQHSLDRAWQSLRSRQAPRPGSSDSADRPALDKRLSAMMPEPINIPTGNGWRGHQWPTLIVLAVAAFVLGMGLLTGVELLHGGPISGGNAGTTVGSLFGRPTQRPTQTRTPGPTSTPNPSPTTTTQASSTPARSTTTTASASTAPSTTSNGSVTTAPTDVATSTPTAGRHP